MRVIYTPNRPYFPTKKYVEVDELNVAPSTTLSSIIDYFHSKGITDFSKVSFEVWDENTYFCIRKEESDESYQERLDQYNRSLEKYNKQVDLLEKMKKILSPEEIALLES
jgi:hypothetical protein